MWRIRWGLAGATARRVSAVESLESRRLMSAGSLDPSFSGDGIATANVAVNESAQAVTVQPDGKVVVAGTTDSGGSSKPDFAVARFTTAGVLDPTFGQGGVVRTDMGYDDVASAVLLQGGKILVGGSSGEFFSVNDFDFAIARYTADGRLDPTFGNGGRVITEFGRTQPARIWAMALQADGKIVAVGELFNVGDTSNDSVAVARYLPNGALDPSFGFGGVVSYQVGDDFPKPTLGRDVAILPDGRILIAADGTAGQGTIDHPTLSLLRLTPDGSLDDTFGSGTGARIIDVGWFQTWSLEVAPGDGSVYVGGMLSAAEPSALVYKFTSEGDAVTGFGTGGHVVIATGGNLYTEMATVLQPDGKLVVTADTPGQQEDWGTWTVARITPNGAFDTTFGAGGKVTVSPGTPDFAHPADVALAPDGKVVVAGTALFSGTSFDIVAARFHGAPQPPAHRVSEVLVSGSGWSEAFKQRLAAAGLGNGGVALTAQATAAPLPWVNIDRVTVRFTGDVQVSAGDLVLSGTRAGRYPTGGFHYDPGTRTATWSLAAPVAADALRVSLSDDVVVDGLDVTFAVLPGDADQTGRVDAADYARLRARTPPARGRAGEQYDARLDVDADGSINVLDLAAVRRRLGTTPPAAAVAKAQWAAVAARGLSPGHRRQYAAVGMAILGDA